MGISFCLLTGDLYEKLRSVCGAEMGPEGSLRPYWSYSRNVDNL